MSMMQHLHSRGFFGDIWNHVLRTSSLLSKHVANLPLHLGEFATCFDSRVDIYNPLASGQIYTKNAVYLQGLPYQFVVHVQLRQIVVYCVDGEDRHWRCCFHWTKPVN